jgi:hypothetical protein
MAAECENSLSLYHRGLMHSGGAYFLDKFLLVLHRSTRKQIDIYFLHQHARTDPSSSQN